MSRRSTSFTPGLRKFISKVITPAVLIGGVLLLLYFNFHSVLKAAQDASSQFRGDIAFSQGNFSSHFQEDAGLDRPTLRYVTQNILSYADWSSTISVDGKVQELWNNYHGYDVDKAKQQVYSTTTGTGWQVTEIVTLVNDHTETVTFNFTQRDNTLPAVSHIVLDIAHVATAANWYNYSVNNGSFVAEVVPGQATPGVNNASGIGKLSVSVTGADVAAPTISVPNDAAVAGDASTVNTTQSFFTEYTIDNPEPQRMITLGTETLTFQPGATASTPGAPLQGVVPVPGQN